MSDIGKLWADIALIYPVVNGNIKGAHISSEYFEAVCQELCHLGILNCLYEILWKEVFACVQNLVVPKFWAHFKVNCHGSTLLGTKRIVEYTDKMERNMFQKFATAVKEVDEDYADLIEILKRIDFLGNFATTLSFKNHIDLKNFQQFFHETLLAQSPPYFNNVVFGFYSLSFREFVNAYNTTCTEDPTQSFTCKGCSSSMADCCCCYLVALINETNHRLEHIGLLDRIAGQAMTSLVQIRIKEHINSSCQGVFDRSNLQKLEVWLENVVMRWLKSIFNCGNMESKTQNINTVKIIQGFQVKLKYFLYETYANKIIDQFFGIIIDFPDSIPAIDDLKVCLDKINMRNHLIKSLKSSLEARILHPGVNTMDILTGYVAAIKAIRHLDNSGIILEAVTAPIKDYLRKRNDTVRRVVTSLTEEGPTDLSEELAKGETVKENNCSTGNNEFSNWKLWVPDPFGTEYCSRVENTNIFRSSDIISMVVDIYGSKELFMNEYRNLMADRLLAQLDFNPDKEIRNLELLKLRFGETLLHSCEVMLKDVADSKRINVHIQSDSKYIEDKIFDISTLIISAQFWPSFNKESLELPEEISKEFEKFTKAYEAYKGNRTLQWRYITGRVNITIELGERIYDMTVSPSQAVIIYHFQNQVVWALDDLSTVMKLTPSVLRRRIFFWQIHGLIYELHPDVFKLVEEKMHKDIDEISISVATDDEEIESAMASASDQREEELQVFWSYIVGMLTNLDSLPLERIHQMLKLFASQGIGIEFSQEELKHFLQRKVREHKLFYSGGAYQLAK